MYEKGLGVSQNNTEALKWYRKAAEQESGFAQFCLAILYYNGRIVKQDKNEALKWFLKAAENGNADAQVHMAYAYLNGEDVVQNKEEAFEWFHKAAEQGHINAIMSLALRYYSGLDTKADLAQAFFWFQKAAEQGNISAISYMGEFYKYGIVVERDENKAFSLYKQAAEKGDDYAYVKLALCYLYGTGTPYDTDLAYFWLNKAKNAGVEEAGEMIKVMNEAYNKYFGTQGDKSYINEGNTTTILLEKKNGVYYLPCKINGIKADFVFDTGAGAISISSSFADELSNKGLLSKNDFLGKAKSAIADGRVSDVIVVNIKDVEIGGMHLRNVQATIREQLNAPLLLGQTAIEKLGKITIDGCKLIIHRERQ